MCGRLTDPGTPEFWSLTPGEKSGCRAPGVGAPGVASLDRVVRSQSCERMMHCFMLCVFVCACRLTMPKCDTVTPPIGVIIGIIIGAVLFAGIIGVIIFFAVRAYLKSKKSGPGSRQERAELKA